MYLAQEQNSLIEQSADSCTLSVVVKQNTLIERSADRFVLYALTVVIYCEISTLPWFVIHINSRHLRSRHYSIC